MSRKIVAVVNDQTGSVHAVLEGYQHYFPFFGIPSKSIEEIRSYGEIGEYGFVKLYFFGFEHIVSTEKYSLVYEEVAE